MARTGSPYGPEYLRERAGLIGLPCELRLRCAGDRADSADHVPPLALHDHVNGSGCCRLQPACRRCQCEQGKRLGGDLRRRTLRRTGRRPLPVPSRQW